MTVNLATPLAIDANVFEYVTTSNITLTVPSGSVSAYNTTLVWQDFGSIAILNVEDFINSLAVDLYPNPVKNQLRISLDSGLKLQKASIYNGLGQFIKSSKTLTTDTSNLTSGIYVINITTNKGKLTKKFIVQ